MHALLATLATFLIAAPAAADLLESTILAGPTSGPTTDTRSSSAPLPVNLGVHTVSSGGADTEAIVAATIADLLAICAMRLPALLDREAECAWTWEYTPIADVFYVITGGIFIADSVPHVLYIDAALEETGGPSLYAYISSSTATVDATLEIGRLDGDAQNIQSGNRVGRLSAGQSYTFGGTFWILSGTAIGGAESVGSADVDLIPVPEPSQLAMLVPGVLLLGAMARFRRYIATDPLSTSYQLSCSPIGSGPVVRLVMRAR